MGGSICGDPIQKALQLGGVQLCDAVCLRCPHAPRIHLLLRVLNLTAAHLRDRGRDAPHLEDHLGGHPFQDRHSLGLLRCRSALPERDFLDHRVCADRACLPKLNLPRVLAGDLCPLLDDFLQLSIVPVPRAVLLAHRDVLMPTRTELLAYQPEDHQLLDVRRRQRPHHNLRVFLRAADSLEGDALP